MLSGKSVKWFILAIFSKHPAYLRWRYLKALRLSEYYRVLSKENYLFTIPFLYYSRNKNDLGIQLGYEIESRNIQPGLVLFHNGPIIIHGNSIIGKNCKLHGDNCIGNNGISDLCPVIGDNVDVGVGAKIIGGIRIADDVKIGAGAVVVKDCFTPGATLVGVPAREL